MPMPFCHPAQVRPPAGYRLPQADIVGAKRRYRPDRRSGYRSPEPPQVNYFPIIGKRKGVGIQETISGCAGRYPRLRRGRYRGFAATISSRWSDVGRSSEFRLPTAQRMPAKLKRIEMRGLLRKCHFSIAYKILGTHVKREVSRNDEIDFPARSYYTAATW